jgi:hypothetical protein
VLLPPPTDTPWCGAVDSTTSCLIRRTDRKDVEIELPLFWHDPPWSRVNSERADIVASAVALSGVLVSVLRSDLAGVDREPIFFRGELPPDASETIEPRASAAAIQASATFTTNRIVPYRPERYGLDVRDFDGAKIIDVRLAVPRDAAGRFAYSPAQLERWEATPASQPLAGGSWVPAATFPPDVVSIHHLSRKFQQLRSLSPNAAVLATVSPFRLTEELPAIAAARPDGIILQMHEDSFNGFQLAETTVRARKMIDGAGGDTIALWIAPGEVTPDDAVKLIALGASAIAVDSWCDSLITETAVRQQTAATRLGYEATIQGDREQLYAMAEYQLDSRIARFTGLYQSMSTQHSSETLGSFDNDWATALGVTQLG